MEHNSLNENEITKEASKPECVKKNRKSLWIVLIAVCLIALAALLYVNTYYHANDEAINIVERYADIGDAGNEMLVFAPSGEAKAGVIFYPGGKIQYESYSPLMKALADEGILCVLLKMPGNLAILDTDAADGIIGQYPNINDWYVAGHSLGGTAASQYVAKHSIDYKGLILLASYSVKDLTDSEIKALLIYGDCDGVLNMKQYQKYYGYLPDNTFEYVIKGGNHAKFGDYGAQKGDGIANITKEEQVQQTVNHIIDFIGK